MTIMITMTIMTIMIITITMITIMITMTIMIIIMLNQFKELQHKIGTINLTLPQIIANYLVKFKNSKKAYQIY